MTLAIAALALMPQAASAADDVPEVIVSNVAVDTATPETATVTFDYAPNDSAEHREPPYRLRVYISPSNVNYWETYTIDYFTISSAGSYSKTFTLAPGNYNASVGAYPILNCIDCGGPEPTVITTVPFTVTAVIPTPEPTPTTPEPTPEPTTPAPQPSATIAPVSPAASLSATSVLVGSGVTVTATGLASSEPVQIWIHSTPVQLWTGAADASGALVQAIKIPADIPLGAHQIEVRGATSGSLWLNLTVRGAELAATGVDGSVGAGVGIGAATLLLGGGAVLLLAKHRRRTAA